MYDGGYSLSDCVAKVKSEGRYGCLDTVGKKNVIVLCFSSFYWNLLFLPVCICLTNLTVCFVLCARNFKMLNNFF